MALSYSRMWEKSTAIFVAIGNGGVYGTPMTPAQIRRKRESLGLSPEQFAEELGVAPKHARITVWRWENEKRTPSPQTIRLINTLKRSRKKQ